MSTDLQVNNLPVPRVYTPELICCSGARMRFRPDIFKPEGISLELTTGISVIASVRLALRKNGYSYPMNGARIYFSYDLEKGTLEKLAFNEWNTTLVGPKSLVNIVYPVHGGGGGDSKNPLATILSIVVMVATIGTGYFLTPIIGALGAAFASAAVGIVGSLLVNAIAPPSRPKLTQQSQSNLNAEKVWSVDGIKNRTALYEPIPWILGKVRFAPRFAASPHTFLSGNDQYARSLFMVLGHNKVEELRIGDTPIDRFKGVKFKIWEKWQGEKFEMFPASIYQEGLNVRLNASGWHHRTSTLDTIELQVEFYMPRGLGSINSEGTLGGMSVPVSLEYRKVGTETWAGFWDESCNGGTLEISIGLPSGYPSSKNRRFVRSASFSICTVDNPDNGVAFSGGSQIATGSWTATWEARSSGWNRPWQWVHIGTSLTVSKGSYSGEITTSGTTITVTTGLNTNNTKSYGKATTTPQRFGYNKIVDEGQYEIRVSSTAAVYSYSSTGNTFNDLDWTIFRSVRSGNVLNYVGVPYTVIELEIKATDQLNGHVDELNALFTSYAPTWVEGTGWVEAPTNCPASLGKLLATSSVIHKSKNNSENEIDHLAWQRFYEWCQEMGWEYNAVQTAEERAGEVLHSILSSARGSFTFKNAALYSVVWDATDKPVKYTFGPRNSWGFRAQKTFKEEKTHALRVLFLNEERDYQEDERIIYNDGYDDESATNIIEKDFDGVTNPELIFKQGRLALADEEWRPETYLWNTDYAFLCVAKGDCVTVSHYVPMWGLAQARIAGIIYADYDYESMNKEALIALAVQNQSLFPKAGAKEEESLAQFTERLQSLERSALVAMLETEPRLTDISQIAGVYIDDYVTMDASKQYAFNYYPSASQRLPFSVETIEGTTQTLKFQTPIPTGQAPSFGGLINFGEAGREDHKCIITAIEPGDNFTALITAQDYSAEEIYKALTGPIPPWDSHITIPSRWQLGKPETPVITVINTDEYVLRRADDGSLIPRIQVGFICPEKDKVIVDYARLYIRKKAIEGNDPDTWISAGTAIASAGFVYAEDVIERVEYEIRIQAVSNLGVPSNFSPVYTALVIGRTTPPPPPIKLRLNGTKFSWQMPEDSPIDVRGWEVFIGMDAADPFSYAKKISNPSVSIMEFDIAEWSGWARRVWVRTIDDIGLASTPVYYVFNLGDVPTQNVVHEVLESDRTWPGLLQNGIYVPGTGLISAAGRITWGDTSMWGDEAMWGGATQQMVYTTHLRVPAEAITSHLKIVPVLAEGSIASIEYEIADSYQMWGDRPMWADLPFMGIASSGAWNLLSNETLIQKDFVLGLRITCGTNTPVVISELNWVFDVEDEEAWYNDILVSDNGNTRISIEEKRFRWIKGISFGLAQTETEPDAARVIYLANTEIKQQGYVIEGPLLHCFNEQGDLVHGRVNAHVQGSKGAYNL